MAEENGHKVAFEALTGVEYDTLTGAIEGAIDTLLPNLLTRLLHPPDVAHPDIIVLAALVQALHLSRLSIIDVLEVAEEEARIKFCMMLAMSGGCPLTPLTRPVLAKGVRQMGGPEEAFADMLDHIENGGEGANFALELTSLDEAIETGEITKH